MKAVFFACVLLIFGGSQGQYLPQGLVPPTCKYEFTVPDTKGACNSISGSLDKKVDQVKQDLDKTRLQYVSQNSIVQNTLAKVQSDTATYVSKVQDLSNELQRLKQAMNMAPSGTGGVANPGNANSQYLNQVIHDTKDLLTKAVQDINDKIFNLTYQFQRSAVEESKVDTAIERQINQQAVQIAKTEQKLINLENQIKNLQTNAGSNQSPAGTTAPIVSGPTSAQIQQLTKQYQKLEQEIKQNDAMQTTSYQTLTAKTNQFLNQVLNQSLEIDSIKTATQGAMTRVMTAESKLSGVKKDLDTLKQKIEPQMTVVSSEVAALTINVTLVEKELQQLGSQLIGNKLTSMQDHAKLTNIESQASLLSTQLQKLEGQVTAQSGTLLQLTKDLNTLSAVPSLGNGTVSNGALQQAVQNFQSQTQTALNKTQSDVQQLQNVVKTLLTQVTSLATSGTSG